MPSNNDASLPSSVHGCDISRLPRVVLEIPGRLPSWNQILAMQHWSRHKFKKELAKEFLSACRASEGDCSMKIIYAKNSTLTYADTLELFLTTAQARRKSKSDKLKSERKKKSLSVSKFFE